MGLKALNLGAPVWFQPDAVEGEDSARFKIRGMDGLQQLQVSEEIKTTDDGLSVSGHGITQVIKFGLLGWENFTDDEGRDLAFTPENVRRIPLRFLSKISAEIFRLSSLSGEQQKNS